MLNHSTTLDRPEIFDPYNFSNNYSIQNVYAIMAQCPHATAIASYRQWQNFDRQVRRGEQAIRILAPIIRKNDDGTEKLGFKSVPVFEIGQTDAIPTEPCSNCSALMAAEDQFCGECGTPRIAPTTKATDAYSIATNDNAPVIIAEVIHVDATPAPTATKTVILGETLAKAVKKITKPLAKAVPAKTRNTCPALANVTIAFTGNGCTIAPTVDTEGIELVRVPMVSYAGTPIIATLDFDNALILAGILDKSDATISTESIPRDLNPNQTNQQYHDQISGMHLVISQTDGAGCRSRTRITCLSLN